MNLVFKFKEIILILLINFSINLYFSQNTDRIVFTSEKNFVKKEFYKNIKSENCFKTGADRSELYLKLLEGKRVGVVTNQTALLSDGKTHLVDFLLQKKINIVRIFAPEHGFRGDADAGEHIKNSRDVKTNLPIISLYGDNKKPYPNQINDLDIIVFDIQDVGVRFYTYISTLTYVMEAAAENNKEVVVLDRPNPHDGYTDGPILDSNFSSFVGMHPVPVVYGLTIGEYGKMVNGEKWLKGKLTANYTVIPLQNYHRQQIYPNYDRPSPNLPNQVSIQLYPSLCFFEGTQVSVARGTDFPFQAYGAPQLKTKSFSFTPKPNFGAKDPFLNAKLCYGEDLRKWTALPLQQLQISWLINAYQEFEPKSDFFLSHLFFDKLAGTDQLRKQIIANKTETEIRASWQLGLQKFEKIRQKYMIYEN